MTDTSTGVEAPKKSKEPAPNKLVSLDELCKELKITGMKARRMLRASGIKHKRNASWEWLRGSPELKEARAVLTK
jgi:hypothetical protein